MNLARRPFVNRRPLHRLVTVLWILAVGLLSINVMLFWSNRSTSTESSRSLDEIRATRAAKLEELEQLQSRFRAVRLPLQNSQVEFLNAKLRERKFPWTRLFQELEEVLPYSVRVQRLAPRKEEERGRERGSAAAAADAGGEWVELAINGSGRDNDSVYQFVDALFEHRSFSEPVLADESQERNGEIRFSLQVRYLARHEPLDGSGVVEADVDATEETAPEGAADETLQFTATPIAPGGPDDGIAQIEGGESTLAVGEDAVAAAVAEPSLEDPPVEAPDVRAPSSTSLAERARQAQELQRQRQAGADGRVADDRAGTPVSTGDRDERDDRREAGRSSLVGGRTPFVGGRTATAPAVTGSGEGSRGGGRPTTRQPAATPSGGGRDSAPRTDPSRRRTIGADDLPERPRDDFPTRNASSGGRP